MCRFYHEPLCTSIETNVNKFAISNYTALKLDAQTLRSYLRLICKYELYILPNKKVSAAKDHGKNYMKDRPPLVRHLLRNRLFLGALNEELLETSYKELEIYQD